VAARDLASGTALVDSDVTVAQIPPALVPAGSTASVDRILGRSLAGPMRAGEVVTDRRLLGRPLIAGYPRGAVAAPVRIADSGVVSLLRVGDRIDVYAARSDASAADLVVAHAPVVALPRVDNDAQQGGLVVLAVTPYQAATLAGASAVGPLSVTLLR
jgi:Flp pilus assembly protein CpaB